MAFYNLLLVPFSFHGFGRIYWLTKRNTHKKATVTFENCVEYKYTEAFPWAYGRCNITMWHLFNNYLSVHTCTLGQSECSVKETQFTCIHCGAVLVRCAHLCCCSALPSVCLVPFHSVRTWLFGAIKKRYGSILIHSGFPKSTLSLFWIIWRIAKVQVPT